MASGQTHITFFKPSYLIANSIIQINTEEKILNQMIWEAQFLNIRPLLGPPLYEALIDMVNADTLTGNYKQLMDEFIIPCLLQYALYEYLPDSTFKLNNRGLSKQNTPDATTADDKEIVFRSKRVLEKAQAFAEVLKRHLQANMNQFPEYLRFRSIEDTPPRTTTYSTGIVFPGDSEEDSFGKGFTKRIN